MKVLWITNVELPTPAYYFNRNTFVGGWMDQSSVLLSQLENVELYILSSGYSYEPIKIDNITYIGFAADGRVSKHISEHIDSIEPDIIHIWGTEFFHSYLAIKEIEKRNQLGKTVISIQGLVSVYTEHYFLGIPGYVKFGVTGYELIKRNTLLLTYLYMQKQGKYERETFRIAQNCIGRTEWDKACVHQINRSIRYFKCNEILRSGFYNKKWNYSQCIPHMIAFSQAHYPIKGVHFLIQALSIVKDYYPDVCLEVPSQSPFVNGVLSKKKIGTYMRYLKKLVVKYNLIDNIRWIGSCDEEGMIDHYLRANVFVCSSTIENSSNSIGEAMLLGMPVIASDVGGVKSIITHQVDGLLYQTDAPYMLADAIMKVFDNVKWACKLGENAQKRASEIHDRVKNTETLKDIYIEMMGN